MRFSHTKSWLTVMPLVVGFVLLVSCDAFEPRGSEEPESGGGGSYEQPQEPTIVVSNLVNTMSESPHSHYPDLFSDDFDFVPDRDDVLTLESIYGQGVFDGWGAGLEVDVGDKIFNRSVLILLDLDVGTITEDTDSTYTVLHQYRLDVLGVEGWMEYRGAAKLRMRQNPSDGLWYISEWEDFRTEASDSSGVGGTWGYLKGEIRATT